MNKQSFLAKFHHLRQISHPQEDMPHITRQASTNKPAAVIIPIVTHDNALSILLTERALHLRHHPGQISFPGGRVEAGETPQQAALREIKEEIGLPATHIEWVGELPCYHTVSRYTVTPLIAFITPGFNLVLDDNEVADAFEVPLSYLCDQQNHFTHNVQRNGVSTEIYFIPYEDKMIWGATAAMLRNLSEHLS